MPFVSRGLVAAQVTAMLRVLEQLFPGAALRLGTDPFAALSRFADLEVRLVLGSAEGRHTGSRIPRVTRQKTNTSQCGVCLHRHRSQ